MLVSQIRATHQVPASLILIQLAANAAREAAKHCPRFWVPATQMVDLDGIITPAGWGAD